MQQKNVWNIILGKGLWVKIAFQKYIQPLNILEWIRSLVKEKENISICWKAVLWAFDIIGNFLVWKIGNGTTVRIGLDPWIGCKWRHVLPYSMLEKLHLAGFFCLSNIGIHGLSVLMPQQWYSDEYIGFVDPLEIDVWNGYLAILKSSHARISNKDDALVWNLSKTGKYTPKEGYAQLMHRDVVHNWWWKVLWKLKCPLKAKSFAGLSFLVKH